MSDDDRSLDERAGELLDGASGDTTPAVVARAADFDVIRAALRDIPEPSAGNADAAVARAMAATHTPPLRRRGAMRTRLLAAAATLTVVAGGAIAISQGSGQDEDFATSGEADRTGPAEAFSDRVQPEESGVEIQADDDLAGAAEDADLGEFDSFDDLRDSLLGGSSASREPPGNAAGGDAVASAEAASGLDDASTESADPRESESLESQACEPVPFTSAGRATVDGVSVEVFRDDALTLYVLLEDECDPRLLSEMTEGPSSP